MTVFFTSDTHFGHENIIRYSNRPFRDVDHMNEMLIKNWNDTVAPEDTVWHLGDVAMGSWEKWDNLLTRLNGQIFLVIGNHDRIFAGNKPAYQQRFITYYNNWFVDYYNNLTGFRLSNDERVNLSHFPYTGDSHDEDRYDNHRLYDDGRTLIHGHTHAEFDKLGADARVSYSDKGTLQIHVGVDAWGYKPVSEDEVIRLIESA